jgi:hypothetical protein
MYAIESHEGEKYSQRLREAGKNRGRGNGIDECRTGNFFFSCIL